MSDTLWAMGGCLCGGIRFQCSGAVVHSLVCHCRMCQRASGASFVGLIFFSSEELLITKGKTRTYRSSSSGIRHFCAECGSSLFFERSTKSLHGIFVGALDDPSLFKPTMHICLSSKQDWLSLSDGLPRYKKKPPGMTPPGIYDSITGKLTEAN